MSAGSLKSSTLQTSSSNSAFPLPFDLLSVEIVEVVVEACHVSEEAGQPGQVTIQHVVEHFERLNIGTRVASLHTSPTLTHSSPAMKSLACCESTSNSSLCVLDTMKLDSTMNDVLHYVHLSRSPTPCRNCP